MARRDSGRPRLLAMAAAVLFIVGFSSSGSFPGSPIASLPTPATVVTTPATAPIADPAATPPAAPPTAAPVPPPGNAAASGAAGPFASLDVPDWVIVHTPSPPKDHPWILVVDDPQCPYCMQLLVALERLRETGDPEISRAVLATLPYPLSYHDQSAHIIADAFCLEASRSGRAWSAASYLDWLIVAPWKEEPGFKTATIDEIGKDGGFFDAKYDVHRVTSSRRRDFQTGIAKAESACLPGGCGGDADCEKLCEEEKTCLAACPGSEGSGEKAEPSAADRAGRSSTKPAAAAAAAPLARDKCLADCASTFVSRRYRQFSKVHSACLLEQGQASVQGRVAAAFAWAVDHKVPGTPTVYAGHPSIGFRRLGDSDNLTGFVDLLRSSLAEARAKLAAAAR